MAFAKTVISVGLKNLVVASIAECVPVPDHQEKEALLLGQEIEA